MKFIYPFNLVAHRGPNVRQEDGALNIKSTRMSKTPEQ